MYQTPFYSWKNQGSKRSGTLPSSQLVSDGVPGQPPALNPVTSSSFKMMFWLHRVSLPLSPHTFGEGVGEGLEPKECP